MRRSLILNPLTVTIALAAVLTVGLPVRPVLAMPVQSQASAVVAERDALVAQAAHVLAKPEVRTELQNAGISYEQASVYLHCLTNDQLASLVQAQELLADGQSSTGSAIVIILGIAALAYLAWRYTKWVDWSQSDLRLRN